MKLEQIRLYEALVSRSHAQLLIHKAFHQPLQALLVSCVGQSFSVEVEKRLVVLLNQLCVSLVQHPQLISVFFHETKDNQPARLVPLICIVLVDFINTILKMWILINTINLSMCLMNLRIVLCSIHR